MIDISNTTSSAFREPPGSDTSTLVPAISMAPLAGGIGFARVGARFIVDGRAYVVRDEDVVTRKFGGNEKFKSIVRCLGVVRQSEFLPCPCGHTKGYDEQVAAHPRLDELRQRNEVHVICGWSDHPWDEAAYTKAKQQRANFSAQLENLENKEFRMLDAAALRAKLGWANNEGPEPHREIVGLFMALGSSGKWLHSHAK